MDKKKYHLELIKYLNVLFLMVIALSGCMAPNLKKFPQPQELSRVTVESDLIVYVDSVNITNLPIAISIEEREKIKIVLMNHLSNSRFFKKVVNYSAKNDEFGEKYIVISAEITPSDNGKINWVVSWPAVYPCPFYWPFQMKKGDVSVEIKSKIFDEKGSLIATQESSNKSEYDITFYGFFRTSPIEDKLSQCYDNAIKEVVLKITSDQIIQYLSKNTKVSDSIANKSKSVLTPLNDRANPPPPSKLISDSDIESHIPAGKGAGRFDVAVIVGNRDYSVSGVPTVDYALNDARTMRSYLEKTLGFKPENIIYTENATFATMNQLFGSERDHRGKLFNYVKPGESNVFVYYVGHGAPDLDDNAAYFVPVDADPQYLKNSGYRLQTFYDNLAKLPAKGITVVLDSCFSGSSSSGMLFQGISSIALRSRPTVSIPNNSIVFSSSADDQVSTWFPEKSHSLFTYFFLKGLQGAADQDGNGTFTSAEMNTYLTENVPYMARRLSGREQNPQVRGNEAKVLAVILN